MRRRIRRFLRAHSWRRCGSDDNFEKEKCSDSDNNDDGAEEDNDGEVVYIDDDEIDVPAFPGEISVDSTQVEA